MTIERWREDYRQALSREWREMPAEAREDIPEHLRGGLDRYVCDRIPTGDFLRAVLANDLAAAVGRANPPETLLRLPRLIQVIHTYAPARCHGSPEAVRAWLQGEDLP